MTRHDTGIKRRKRDTGSPLLDQARSRMRRLNVKASKGLGQHFLVDADVLQKIVAAAELERNDTVLEVGPGLGILTAELTQKAGRVIAVEIDSKLASILTGSMSGISNLNVVNADILDLEPGDIEGISRGYKVVANLPYYVASHILRRFLEASVKPHLMVVMVQKEVGESITAVPGNMSLLSVSVQVYGKASIVDYVPAAYFHPRPRVDSAIVRIDVYPEPAINTEDIDGFFNVVKAGFATPRKQLRNSLSLGLQLTTAETGEILEQAGISPQRRPQTLSLQEWASVYREASARGVK